MYLSSIPSALHQQFNSVLISSFLHKCHTSTRRLAWILATVVVLVCLAVLESRNATKRKEKERRIPTSALRKTLFNLRVVACRVSSGGMDVIKATEVDG